MSQKETTQNPSVEQLQRLHRRRMTIFGSIILIAGIAIGSASTFILMQSEETSGFGRGPTGPDAAERMVGHLKRVLDLTAEQEKEIRLICKTAFDTIHEIQAIAKPKIDAAIKKMNQDISRVLTKEQNAKWERDIKEWKERWSERWHRGRRPGEGGPGSGRRRGPGDPNREFRGPGRYGPGDPNRPRGDFDREAMMRERYRRGDGPFDRRPRPDDLDRPHVEPPAEGETEGE